MSSIQHGISNLIKRQRICLEENDALAIELMSRVDNLNTVIMEKEQKIYNLMKDENTIYATLSEQNKKLDAASDLLESISRWFYKNIGMPKPMWSDQYDDVCKLFLADQYDSSYEGLIPDAPEETK